MTNTSSKELFQEAHELHQSGKLTAAAKLYNNILKEQPDNINVIFLAGTLNLQQRNFEVACMFFRKVLELNPDYALVHGNLGIALHESGKIDEAIKCYRKAITLKPNHVNTYFNLGNALKQQGKLEEAVTCYKNAIVLNPKEADLYGNLGNTYREHGKLGEAVECYRQAVALNPDNPGFHCNLGAALHESGSLDEAILSYKEAVRLDPDYAMAYSNLGSILQEAGKLNEAITIYKKVLTLKPNFVMAYCNLGSALHESGLLHEAKTCYEKAITLNPDYAMAYSNLGSILQEFGNIDEAINNYDRAIALNPDESTAHKNKSIALLLKENFTEGWPEYEWRLQTRTHSLREFREPRWDGTPLNGKSILIHSEQGFGDTIQFIRYLPMVKAQGGHVIFECHKNLFRLLKNCTGTDKVIERSSNLVPEVQFDFHIPLLSLPGLFSTTMDTIPSDGPYITVDSDLVEKWHKIFNHDSNVKIGIAWSGNPSFKNNHNRSCSLSDFATLAEINELSFYSLQKGPTSVENSIAPMLKITDLKNELKVVADCNNDFADTAAVISNLDLVISTDTAVVHLAGAMGKPVWTLLHSAPDWRWWLKRTDSPWYPSMRLFRQTQLNGWTGVFEQVKESLISSFVRLPAVQGLRIVEKKRIPDLEILRV